jgi:hypothetical protein
LMTTMRHAISAQTAMPSVKTDSAN